MLAFLAFDAERNGTVALGLLLCILGIAALLMFMDWLGGNRR